MKAGGPAAEKEDHGRTPPRPSNHNCFGMSESVDEGAKNTEKKLEGAADQEEDLAAEDIEQLEYQGLTFLEYMEEFEVIKQDALGETRKDIYSYSNSRSTEKQSSPGLCDIR
uniref:Uncharacterized protein n=1 Tax=Vitrella brassicaformis TaxID=1169539 RepID=A0A7S1JN63_9ALVE